MVSVFLLKLQSSGRRLITMIAKSQQTTGTLIWCTRCHPRAVMHNYNDIASLYFILIANNVCVATYEL